MTPGVSILENVRWILLRSEVPNSRLALEVFHYIQKSIVNIRLINEADLNLIQVAQSVLYIHLVLGPIVRRKGHSH